MKKILSLLALLMTTVAAMATVYTGKLTYTMFGSTDYNVPEGENVIIESTGDNQYSVTLKNCDFSAALGGSDYNFGDLTFAGLSGTTTDGITTINAANPTSSFTASPLYSCPEGDLLVKFNDTKAYVCFDGKFKIGAGSGYSFYAEFGTNDFSTGGGSGTEEPVVEYPINFDKDATHSYPTRRISWISLQVTGGEKQTISVTPGNCYVDATTGDEKFVVPAGSEVTPSFDYNAEWMHGYVYIDLNNDKQFSWNADGDDQTGTELVAFSYINGKNSKGESADAGCNVFPPSFTAPTTPGTYRIRYKIDWDNADPGGSMTSGNTIIKNGGGIWDATLVVEPTEEPFAPVVRTAEDVAYVTYGGTTTNYTANEVEVNEYEQGKLKVTYKDLTVGNNRLGDLTIDNVTSTVGEDGTETLTTTATEGKWSNVSDNQIVLTYIPGETSAISNFAATLVPGTEANTIEKLNLTFDVTLAGSDANVVFGAQKVLPVKYTNKLMVKSVATDEIQTYENAEITVLDKGEGKYEFTIPSFKDDEGDDSDPIIFEADGVETDGKIVYTATDVEYPMTGAWGEYNMVATVSIVSAESSNGTLTAKFNISLGGAEDFVLGYGVAFWEAKTTTFTAPANITFGGQTVNFDEATLEATQDPKDVYAVTYKNLTINGNEIGDFTIKNVTVATSENNVVTFSTTDTEGTWTRVVENNVLNVEAGSTVAIRNFEGTSTYDESTETEKVVVKFGLNITGEWADVVFGEKAEPVTPPTPECEFIDVVDHGYAPAGAAWQKTGVAIDWDTQYIKAEIDLSTCKTVGKENILSIGDDLTGWNDGPHYHFYYDANAKELQYNYLNNAKKDLNGGYANLSKAYLNAEGVVTIELSKKHGLKINGESCLVKYVPTANSVATNGTESWTEDDIENVFGNLWAMSEIGFGGCQGETMSNATYNYIHILDLPLEPKTNTFDGQLQIKDYSDQTIAKEEEAQVEITDNGDGTGSLTFKNVQLGVQTVDLTFVGTFGNNDVEEYDETEDNNEFLFTGKSDETTTAVFGKELTLECQGTQSETDLAFMLAMTSADETINYFGQFGKNLWNAISNINADAVVGNAQIFTIGGAKLNSLQKGINIVRTADGKTIKVVRK